MRARNLLVANRGEIAVRIIRAARELGLRSIQAYSDADSESLAVQLADEAVPIGPPQATKSYLSIPAILNAAVRTGADAIHPGYGFLSESAAFAQAVEDAGLIFIGPQAETIAMMGDKARARETATRSGLPVVPGSEGRLDNEAAAAAVADRIGYPVLLKAAAGGGGRGIRVAESSDEFATMFPQASAEARAAFGDGGLYLEKLIARARHIEVQVLGDGVRAVHCYERECSLQRRRQKVWEEAPSAALTPELRERLCRSAVQLAETLGYRGAGTLEFLLDDDTGQFFFIEMNTRIQVEHPVTEMVTGADLVREMIHICAGEGLRLRQEDLALRGHAIEVRINAEDPEQGFKPAPGTLTGLRVPGGGGTRFDTLLYPGCTVSPFYDSLVGKLIIWDETRPAALARLRRALAELSVEGVPTTKALHERLATVPDVHEARVHTRWLEGWLSAQTGSGGQSSG